jgi:hypothetical protein
LKKKSMLKRMKRYKNTSTTTSIHADAKAPKAVPHSGRTQNKCITRK